MTAAFAIATFVVVGFDGSVVDDCSTAMLAMSFFATALVIAGFAVGEASAEATDFVASRVTRPCA